MDFTLRPNLKFSDGSALTSADRGSQFAGVAGSEKCFSGTAQHWSDQSGEQDANTVLIETDAPYADLPVMLAYPDAKIIPASIAQGQYDKLTKLRWARGRFKLVSYDPERKISGSAIRIITTRRVLIWMAWKWWSIPMASQKARR
ncbi:ABC transporter substrate-binding protein (plasmid) [Pseudomonas silvicola]|nr:ABC transporter substrate-binding protein [Pseudomonas silvicola]